MRVIVSLNPNGTASVTTPIAQEDETEAQAEARVLVTIPGGELLSPELVAALRAGDTPPGTPIPVAELYRRLAPVYLAIASKSVGLQSKWDRIIGPSGLLSKFSVIDLADPLLHGLASAAVADELLSQEQADDLLA